MTRNFLQPPMQYLFQVTLGWSHSSSECKQQLLGKVFTHSPLKPGANSLDKNILISMFIPSFCSPQLSRSTTFRPAQSQSKDMRH